MRNVPTILKYLVLVLALISFAFVWQSVQVVQWTETNEYSWSLNAPTGSDNGNAVFHSENLSKRSNETVTTSTSSSELEDIDVLLDFPDMPFYDREPSPRPPLDSIVNGWEIVGDASWLLQFAVTGFPKCGTSTLLFHLAKHPQIQMFDKERCDMEGRQYATLIRDLYHQKTKKPSPSHSNSTGTNVTWRRGIKCPRDMENMDHAIPGYTTYFPKTKLIVGVRHPVLWFESFYNYRVHNQVKMLPAWILKGASCGRQGVCTDRGQFHVHLAHLGRTPLSPTEVALMEPHRFQKKKVAKNITLPIFLYDVQQLSDPNERRSFRFRQDLTHFLELDTDISPFIWFKPGRNYKNTTKMEEINRRKIDICGSRYDAIRGYLMENAVNASRWIVEYFLHSPGVYVSSRNHFEQSVMKSWHVDPCIERRRQNS